MRAAARQITIAVAMLAAIAVPRSALADGEPIRLGFVAPYTGPGSGHTKSLVNGVQLYLESIGNNIAGRTVQFVPEDDQGVPATATAAVHDLISRKHINVLSGIFPNAMLMESEKLAQEHQIPCVAVVPDWGNRPAGWAIGIPAYAQEPIAGGAYASYSPALESPNNKQFAKHYLARYGVQPDVYAEAGYTSMLWLDYAIHAIHGNVENNQALSDALRSVNVTDAPRGPMKLDANGQIKENVYRIRKENGRDLVVKTIPMVTTIPDTP